MEGSGKVEGRKKKGKEMIKAGKNKREGKGRERRSGSVRVLSNWQLY